QPRRRRRRRRRAALVVGPRRRRPPRRRPPRPAGLRRAAALLRPRHRPAAPRVHHLGDLLVGARPRPAHWGRAVCVAGSPRRGRHVLVPGEVQVWAQGGAEQHRQGQQGPRSDATCSHHRRLGGCHNNRLRSRQHRCQQPRTSRQPRLRSLPRSRLVHVHGRLWLGRRRLRIIRPALKVIYSAWCIFAYVGP
ncbi:hypothetical protein TPAR_00667, partial [Tolypocladium paradoxum]